MKVAIALVSPRLPALADRAAGQQALKNRDSKLSPAQIAEAQLLVRERKLVPSKEYGREPQR